MREKSARLTQLNRELESPSCTAAEESQDEQDDDDGPDFEDDAPAQEPSTISAVEGGKPSIRAALRS